MTASRKQRHPARQRGGRVLVPVRRPPLEFQLVSVLMIRRVVPAAEIAAMNRSAAMRLSNRGGGP
jgi:hypothetical protein